ncbi:MAG: lysoplasmalogenase [Cyclobacteriaceae bacterium]|nr:lysoplasmalogenase [Cyclobacteriaceae bacterium]
MNRKVILSLFLAASLANILSFLIALPDLNRYTKPLLMPLLMLYLYESSRGHVTKKTLLLFVALVFSWAGDIALMQEDGYFLLGVGLFFITQLSYIYLFLTCSYQTPRVNIRIVLLIAFYGVVLFSQLLPHAGLLRVPLVIYGISLLFMSALAYHRQGLTGEGSYYLTSAGATLFLFSDSLLALNRFSFDIPYSQVWVMVTYLSAQFLITDGIIRHAD